LPARIRPDIIARVTTGGRIPVLWLCGPPGVGKSTDSWQLYTELAGSAGHHRLKAGNLAAVWHNYRAAGATHLVATGPIGGRPDVQLYAEALTGAGLGVVRLRAGRQELARRIMSRSAGGSWPEPGDPLRGRSAGFLARVARQAAQDQAAQDQAAQDQAAQDAGAGDWLGSGGLAIDTTGRSPEESARLIADALGWPPTRPM
jgi:DNA polymerase III delta prime subunit